MIKTKAALIEVLRANPTARIHGHMGARPASNWSYEVRLIDGTFIDTLSAAVAHRMKAAKMVICLRGSWSFGVYKVSHRFFEEAQEKA